MNSRKTSVLLNRFRNIQIVIELSYLRRLSRSLEKYIYIFRIGNKKIERGYKKTKRVIKVSKVSAENIMKKFIIVERFKRKIENSCLNLSTVAERSI